MEGNIAATYTLVYRFLKQQSQTKAAEAVKKAAKAFVILRDDVEQEGPSLEDIIKKWKETQSTKSASTESSSEDSDSSDDGTSSDSESSEDSPEADAKASTSTCHVQTSLKSEDSSDSESESDNTSDNDDSGDDSDERMTSKKGVQKTVEHDDISDSDSDGSDDTSSGDDDDSSDGSDDTSRGDDDDSNDDSDEGKTSQKAKKTVECDTSVTLSSVGESTQNAAEQVVGTSKKVLARDAKKTTQGKRKTSESESSSSDSDSDSSEDATSDSSDAESSSSSSSSNSSSSDKSPQSRNKATKDTDTSESSSDSESESESQNDAHITKKRKVSEHVAVATGIAKAPQKNEKEPRAVKTRFQRIKAQNLVPESLLDNGFKARGGASNDYGERAHRDLIVTRGAGFRKEKNKKKRGSYRGGEITMESHSIKFDF